MTSRTMAEIDRIALEETGPNLYQMMENAGRTLASFVLGKMSRSKEWGRVLVLAGPGGNGGGGICAARHLANHGVRVSVALVGEETQKPIVREQLNIFRRAKGTVVQTGDWEPERFDILIDALLGYSLKGEPAPQFERVIRRAKEGTTPVLALDIPSGVDATTGEAPGPFLPAQWTLTLALPKTGLSTRSAGRIFLADIGIPYDAYRRAGVTALPQFGARYWIPLICRASLPEADLPNAQK